MPFESSPATSSAKWRPCRESRKSRTPSGEASVAAAIIALAAFQACIGSAPAVCMVPKKPQASFRVGRIVEVIVVLRSSVCLTRHMRRSARDPS